MNVIHQMTPRTWDVGTTFKKKTGVTLIQEISNSTHPTDPEKTWVSQEKF